MKIHEPTHRIGAFAVISDSAGQVLLSRRSDSGWWNLPGGGVEPHESATEGVVREVLEETGLDVTVSRLVGVYSKPQKHEIVLVFACQVVGGSLEPSEEAEEHRWFSPDMLPQEHFLPKHRERLEDALRHEAAAVIRDQRQPPVGGEKVSGM